MEKQLDELIKSIETGIKGYDAKIQVLTNVIGNYSNTIPDSDYALKARFIRIYEGLRLTKYLRDIDIKRFNACNVLKDYLSKSIDDKEYEKNIVECVRKIEEASLQNKLAKALHEIHYGDPKKVKEYQSIYYDLKNIVIKDGLDYLVNESIDPMSIISYIKSSNTRNLENENLHEQKK